MAYTIVYNNVTLEVLRVYQYNRTPIFRGPDYLYTEHQIFVRCVYNPQAVAYTLPGPLAGPMALKGANVGAPETDLAIKHALSQPHQQLVWTIPDLRFVNDRELLRSPSFQAPGGVPGTTVFSTDAANGPFPRAVNVVAIKGTKTFLVDFAITTYVNECQLFTSPMSVMLAHRWEMTEDLDRDFFSTRTIRGYAVFRTDRLLALGRRADDFRSYLFHAVPEDFKRDVIQVKASADGTQVDYLLVDRERAINLIFQGLTHAEIIFGSNYLSIGVENIIWSGIDVANPFTIARGDKSHPGWLDVSGFFRKGAPSLNHLMEARVWGSGLTTRQQLLNALNAIQQFFMSRWTDGLSGLHISASADMMGRYAEMKIATIRGPVASFFSNASDQIKEQFLNSAMLQTENIDNVTNRGPMPNPLPATDKGTRQNYVEGLVSAALQAPCGVPSQPDTDTGGSTVPFRNAIPSKPP